MDILGTVERVGVATYGGTALGDLDENGLITSDDVALLVTNYGAIDGAVRPSADIDGNGVVDAADVELAGFLMTADPALQSLFVSDMDLDGQTTLADVFVVAHEANEQMVFEPNCPEIINDLDQNEFDCDPDNDGGGPESPDFPVGGDDGDCDDLPQTTEVECYEWALCKDEAAYQTDLDILEDCQREADRLRNERDEACDELDRVKFFGPSYQTYSKARTSANKIAAGAIEVVHLETRADLIDWGADALTDGIIATSLDLIGGAFGGPLRASMSGFASGLVVYGLADSYSEMNAILASQRSRAGLIRDAANGYPSPPGSIPGAMARVSEGVRVARLAYWNDLDTAENAKDDAESAYQAQMNECALMEQIIQEERTQRLAEHFVDCLDSINGEPAP